MSEYEVELTVDFVKERPILFKGEMVRAILEGRKTQTRRLLKWQPLDVLPMNIPDAWITLDVKEPEPHGKHIKCRLGKTGDRLWVRETLQRYGDDRMQYAADISPVPANGQPAHANGAALWPWKTNQRPSIFMPRWASRITLEIVNVRCGRLQDITETDAIAEGIALDRLSGNGYWKNYEFTTAHPRRTEAVTDEKHRIVGYKNPIDSYASLWRSINGAGSWDANPWVWGVEFKRVAQ